MPLPEMPPVTIVIGNARFRPLTLQEVFRLRDALMLTGNPPPDWPTVIDFQGDLWMYEGPQ